MPQFWLALIFGVLSVYIYFGATFGTTENAFITSEDQLLFGMLPTSVIALAFACWTVKIMRVK